ncbi:hypothetical protein BN1088_1430495 [Sphingobacterium sp. PM2-P1-29]|nr:hypothetical protein BN1088_1430495 [Sphingobacterium sp. PM2-P1-29]
MKPIIIDAATIFDPASLIAVLASVDIRYSEVWVSQRYDHFKEKEFITGLGTDSKFALLPDENNNYKTTPLEAPTVDEKLDPKSWSTGPKILRWALKQGMVVPKDLYKYEDLAIELERKNKINQLSEAIMLGPAYEFDVRSGEKVNPQDLSMAWRLEPYGIGHGLGLMLAVAQEENVDPYFSHPYFSNEQSTHNYTFYQRDQAIKNINQHIESKEEIIIQNNLDSAKMFFQSADHIQLADVAFYLRQKERVDSIRGIINASNNLENRGKDIGIIAGKFVGTYLIDLFAFAGLPVSTGAVSFYDAITRFYKKD